MAETYGTLIDYIQGQLLGVRHRSPVVRHAEECVSGPAILSVQLTLSGDTIPQGVIEIDDELIFLSGL
jgi:hypothetical protein